MSMQRCRHYSLLVIALSTIALHACGPSTHEVRSDELGIRLTVPSTLVMGGMTDKTLTDNDQAIAIHQLRIYQPNGSFILVLQSQDPQFAQIVLRYVQQQDTRVRGKTYTRYTLDSACHPEGFVTKEGDNYYAIEFDCFSDSNVITRVMDSVAFSAPTAAGTVLLIPHKLQSRQMPIALTAPAGFQSMSDAPVVITVGKDRISSQQWTLALGNKSIDILASHDVRAAQSPQFGAKRERAFSGTSFVEWTESKDPEHPIIFTALHQGIAYVFTFRHFTSEADIDAVMRSLQFTDAQ